MVNQFTETETRSIGFWVAATERLIFGYFGDSQELIAFDLGAE